MCKMWKLSLGLGCVSAAWVGMPQKVWEMSGKRRGILHCLESGHPAYFVWLFLHHFLQGWCLSRKHCHWFISMVWFYLLFLGDFISKQNLPLNICRVSTTPGNLLEFNSPPGNFCVRWSTALVSGHKRLTFYCLDIGNSFNNDDVSLNIEQCNIKNVANVVGWIAQWWALVGAHHHMLH